jgi:hypothetical protein
VQHPQEDSAELAESDAQLLRRGRLMLWIAIAAAIAFLVLAAATSNTKVAAFFHVIAAFAGLGGIGQVAAARGSHAVVRLAAQVAAIMPFVNLAALAWFALGAQLGLGDVQARLAKQQRSARERARTVTSALTSIPEPRRGGDLSRAIASVKLAGVATQAEGTPLQVSISDPRIAPGQVPDIDLPVMRATKGVFGVAYLVDRGDHYVNVSQSDLQRAGLTLEQLHQAAVRNLAARIEAQPGVALHPQGAFFGLTMGGDFEASLVLVDALWDGPLKQHTPNGAMVAIPARDVCAFCDARSAEGIAALKQVVQRVTRGGDHLLSERLFLRKDGRWTVLGGTQPAKDLPPLEFPR